MVATDLVEAPSSATWISDFFPTPQRTSWFKVIEGEPMALDMTTLNHGDRSVLHTRAIYVLDGDHLTYCVGAPGQPRPGVFSTETGDGNTRVVLKRVEKK
jgi:uncharacterized protein (TIGR03067 family)